MAELFDPYAVLGVPRDADEKTARKAFRDLAKTAHPDAEGGSAEKFAAISRALAVLTDPEKRRRFDNTGTVDDDKPDNVRAAALQVIQTQLMPLINLFIGSDFNPAHDPRRVNVVQVVADKIRAEIAEHQKNIDVGKRVVELNKDMAARFRSDDEAEPLQRNFLDNARNAEKTMDGLAEGIRMREKALEILAGYQFLMDESYGNGSVFVSPIRSLIGASR